MRALSTPLLALLGFVLAVAGAWTMYREGESYLRTETSPAERVLALPDGGTVSAISTVGQRNAITDCWRVLGDRIDLEAIGLDDETKTNVASRCAAIADEITRTSPTFSFAWYIGALANAQLRKWDEFNRQLTLSQQTGANEQWIGNYRVTLAEDYFSRLDAAAQASHAIDLAMLVTTYRGAKSVAARYARDPSFRERITTIVAAAPQDDQRQFLRMVQELASK